MEQTKKKQDKKTVTPETVFKVRPFRRRLFGVAGGILLFCGLLTVVFDPFYHYHKPWLHLKAILNEKEYQVVGTLRNFDYDAVLAGSSVVENVNNRDLDNAFGCTSVKAVRSYGGMADLCWLLDVAYEKHEIHQVFFNVDPSSLSSEPETTFAASGCPMYLYDKNPFNDVKYLFNRDVIFKRIPYEVAQSLTGYYDEGKSYNWASTKEFDEDAVLGHYMRMPSVREMQPENIWEEQCTGNLALLMSLVNRHPETTFRFFFPPYSMLWWDNELRTGERDAVLANELRFMETMLPCDNVEIYYFQDAEEIITDLNNYMDTLHFHPRINAWMTEEMAAGTHRATVNNMKNLIEGMRALSDSLQNGYLREIGEEGRFQYELPDKE